MIEINTDEIERLADQLREFNDVAYPIAVQSATNANAFAARKRAIKEIEYRMITRNNWTTGQGSLVVEKSPRTRKISDIQAVMGTTRDYLADQEFGGSKRNTAIPTGDSANQSGRVPRTRVPVNSRAMRNVRLTGRRGRGNNVAMVRNAKANNQKFLVLDLSRGRRAVFRVFGTKKRPKIRMIADITKRLRITPKNPWMQPTLDVIRFESQGRYVEALNYQAARLGLFKI